MLLQVCYGNMSILLKGEAEPLSPGYVPQGYPKNNPTLLTVMGMVRLEMSGHVMLLEKV